MSKIDFRAKLVDKERARKMIKEIVLKHPENVVFSNHAEVELANDGYSIMDGWNVLKSVSAKISRGGELDLRSGAYRYRLETKQFALIIQFWPNGNGLAVITGWATKGVVR